MATPFLRSSLSLTSNRNDYRQEQVRLRALYQRASTYFQRIDIQENNILISCLLAINTIQETDELVDSLREIDPSAKISFLDDSTYPNE